LRREGSTRGAEDWKKQKERNDLLRGESASIGQGTGTKEGRGKGKFNRRNQAPERWGGRGKRNIGGKGKNPYD